MSKVSSRHRMHVSSFLIKVLGVITTLVGAILFLPLGHAGFQFGPNSVGKMPIVIASLAALCLFLGLISLPYNSKKKGQSDIHAGFIAVLSFLAFLLSVALCVSAHMVQNVFKDSLAKPAEQPLFANQLPNSWALDMVTSQFDAVLKNQECSDTLCVPGLSSMTLRAWKVVQTELFNSSTANCQSSTPNFCKSYAAVVFDIAKPLEYATIALGATCALLFVLFCHSGFTLYRRKDPNWKVKAPCFGKSRAMV